MVLPKPIETSMDFLNLNSMLSNKQIEHVDRLRKAIKEQLQPKIRGMYQNGEFLAEIPGLLGSLHALGLSSPSPDRNSMDPLTYGLTMRELERCDSGIRSFASVQGALVMHPIRTYGTAEQQDLWLDRLKAGKAIGSFALSEGHGGSDPGAMHTTARLEGNQWVLNGSKAWVTNGAIADIFIVWAKTKDGVRGFLVPRTSSGMKITSTGTKLSLRASITSSLAFENTPLAKTAILPDALGVKAALSCLTQARYGIVWGVLGAAEACFRETREFCRDRLLFGNSLHSYQLIQAKFAKILGDLSVGQLLAMRLSQLKSTDELTFSHVSLGKQRNVQMALETARTCRDILGAHGILDEFETMRHMCNLETVSTYEGTNDIHLLIMGQHLTGIQAFTRDL